MSYYNRENVVHLDGTNIFQTKEDRDNELEVATLVEGVWHCKFHRFGALSPVDWFAERMGRLVGIAELKSRPHERNRYPTVFLNVRKWLSLTVGSVGLGCPAVFIVKFNDGVFWCRVSEIDASNQKIGGCSKIVKSHSDIEPVIEVPVLLLTKLDHKH